MNKLRVGIVVNQYYRPESGGGYSYYNILLDAINRYEFDERVEVSNVIIYDGTKPAFKFPKPSIFIENDFATAWKRIVNKRILKRLGLDYIKQNFIGNYVFSISRGKQERRIESILARNKIDLLYYINPVDKVLNYPFIMTHWDVGHRSTYPFPFLAMNGIYETRENYYNYVLNKALLIFCESNAGKKELLTYYSFYKDKIKILPLFGGMILKTEVSTVRHQRVLEKFSLDPQKFFLYPAQFWPHKNHYHLVMAFNELQKVAGNEEVKLVLSGSDKGNMKYIWELIKSLQLEQKVLLTGFVSNEELHALYTHAIAMVMPTFLGPTNLPLIEASSLNCPVLCSDFEGHKEILGDSALYFDPKGTDEITSAMQRIMDPQFRQELIESAEKRIKQSVFNINNNMEVLNSLLTEATKIRKVWGT